MPTLPTGTVTFMFTDIQGSTRLWEESREQMRVALERHDEILSGIIDRHSGTTFKTVGDAYCAVFQRAVDAALAAVEIQRAVEAETWDLPRPVRVRIGIHTGEAHERNDDYYGQVVNRVARLEACAHGGQTVVSAVTHEIVRDQMPDGVGFRDLGQHRLKDLSRAQTVLQLEADGLPTDFPPLASLDRHAHNLPVQTTPFIGRQETLESLRALVTGGDHRIVSVLGPGGMGKTRIALQVAGEEIDRFEDGAWFVDLSSVRDEIGFYSAIAEAVGPGGERSALSKADVLSLLGDRRMLLVLDNFEQLADVAPVVAELASSCGGLQFVVTTRVALRIRGETAFDLPPLTMPDERETEPVEALGQYEAVKLFIDRAEAVSNTFFIDRTNAPAVAAICHRLDGIPLAIELAAARARMLSPHAILDRLTHRLKLLTGGSRDLPTRQQTLRRTIDWSYELLEEDGRRTFAALGAFDGLIRLPAAEAVLVAIGLDEVEALDQLQSLVDQSLLVVVPIDEETPTFAMLETIHEYAGEVLDNSSFGAEVRDAHAGYFGELIREFIRRLQGAEQSAWIRTTWSEYENIRSAERWLSASDVPDTHAEIALGYSQLLSLKGMSEAAAAVLISVDELPLSTEWQIRIACERARVFHELGDVSSARKAFDRCRPLLGALSAVDEIAHARFIAALLEDVADPADREPLFQDVLEAAREARDTVLEGRVHTELERICLHRGDLDEALRENDLARACFQTVGDGRRLAQTYSNRGITTYLRGDLEQARTAFEEAARELTATGDIQILTEVYSNLTTIHLALGNRREAEQCARMQERTARMTGNRALEAIALGALAEARLLASDTSDATGMARRGLDVARTANGPVAEAYLRRVLGDCLLAIEDPHGAAREYELAVSSFSELGDQDELRRSRTGLDRARSLVIE